MSMISIIDFITFLASLCLIIIVLRGKNTAINNTLKYLVYIFFALVLFHSFSNVLQWSNITSVLDSYEDYIQMLEPVFVFFIIYTYYQASAESRMHNMERLSELMFKNTPSGIFTIGNDKKIISWNKGAEIITGYSEKDVIGKECSIFSTPSCESGCALFSKDSLKPITGKECTMKGKDGRTLTLLKNLDLLKDKKGNVIGGIESFVDITERKMMNADIIRKSKELEKFNKVAVDRELKMIELKNEVNELLERQGEEKRYNSMESSNKGRNE